MLSKILSKLSSTDQSFGATDTPQNEVQRLLRAERRRVILEWRDRHELRVESVLRSNLPGLKSKLHNIVTNVPFGDFYFSSGSWPGELLEPVIEEWVKRQSADILAAASEEGINLLQERGGVGDSKRALETSAIADDLIDVASSIGPVAAGFLAVPTLASSSVVSAGGFMGLLGVTAISWPVVVVGGAIATSMVAFGANRTFNIRERANQRLIDRLDIHIETMILGVAEDPESDGGSRSLMEALQSIIRETAIQQLSPDLGGMQP